MSGYLVAIHQLPKTEDTLWLRLLGRGKVQEQAIDEIEALPANHPLQSNILRLLTNLQANLQAHQELEQEEQDLIMKLSPLYIQWREEALQEGEQKGIEQGIRLTIESMLKVNFGEIDEELSQIVEPLTKMTAEEAIRLVWRSSREELLTRLRTSNEGQDKLLPLYLQWREEALKEGEQRGVKQTMRLTVESILEVKFGEIDEELSQIVEPLTKLTTKEAAQLVWRLPREELLARLRTSNIEES